MAGNDQSLDTLVSISGTMASIGLALVGILAAKSALDHTETLADDLFLVSSLGFMVVLALGYVAQKDTASPRYRDVVRACEWLFSASLFCIVSAAFVLVYTEI